MRKVSMPDPVGYLYQTGAFKTIDLKLFDDIPHNTTVKGVISTDQAEAYAADKVREAQQWHPIDSAPHETLVVLGWYDENGVFKQEIALASAGRRYPGGASDMWWHGRATHWMPLPAPPLPGPVEPTT